MKKRDVKELIKSYTKKIVAIKDMLDDPINKEVDRIRLTTKASEYRVFITELKRLIEPKEDIFLLCTWCDSDNLKMKDDHYYCKDCQKDTDAYMTDLKKNSKVEGFQVVSNDDFTGDIHPDMGGSFCIYSLSQAKKMIEKDPKNWRLLTIWTNDVEEPTYCYDGNNPRV